MDKMKKKFSKYSKKIIFVLGLMYELGQDGLLIGKNPLSKKGLEMFKKLKKSGFDMIDEEINETMDFLRQKGILKTLDDIKAEIKKRKK